MWMNLHFDAKIITKNARSGICHLTDKVMMPMKLH